MGSIDESEKSHVPTADRVSRVFSGANMPPMFSSASEDDNDEELEEIDFNDISKLLDVPSRPNPAMNADVAVVEERFTGFFIDTNPTPTASDSAMAVDETLTPLATVPPNFSVGESTIITEAVDQETAQLDVTAVMNIDVMAVAALSISDADTDDILTPIAVDPLQAFPAKEHLPPPPQEEFAGFYIDTEPARIDSPHVSGASDINIEEDDEVIVYVAPHPRSGRLTPAPSDNHTDGTSLPSTSILTGTTRPPAPSPGPSTPLPNKSSTSKSILKLPSPSTPIPPAPAFESISFAFSDSPAPRKQPRQMPVFTARAKSKAQLKQRRQEARAARKRAERQAMFGSFGAMMSEAQLRGGSPKRDPRWDERRRDDSDVDWGDEDGGGEQGEGEATGLAEGMDLDPDLVMDVEAMKSFAKSMSQDGSQFVTMDDIADSERMRAEDDEGRDVGSSGDDEEDETTGDEEADAVVNAEENTMLAEFGDIADFSDDDESDEDDTDDEGHSPRTGFQARLERLRTRARGKRPKDARRVSLDDDSSDGDDDDAFERNLTWAEQDEDFIAHIEVCVMIAFSTTAKTVLWLDAGR